MSALRWLKSRHLFLTVLEDGRKSEMTVPAVPVLMRALFLARRQLSSGCVLRWLRAEALVSLPRLVRARTHYGGSTLMTHLNPVTSQRPQLLPHWGLFSIITVLHHLSMDGDHCTRLPGSFTSSNFFWGGRQEPFHHTQATMGPGISAKPFKAPPVWTRYLAIASPGFHALL